MFEAGEWSPEWKDTWWEKLAGVLMLFNGFRFCKPCQGVIEDAQEGVQ